MIPSERRRPARRYSKATAAKCDGAIYTPQNLAQFVAQRMVDEWSGEWSGSAVRILDPAAGDGALLFALVESLLERYPDVPMEVFGFEPNLSALNTAHKRLLNGFPTLPVSLVPTDFLEHVGEQFGADAQMPLFAFGAFDTYDLVIANPPYVRTQVMGARRAKSLGKQFGLAGRVDLYHAFMLAIPKIVNPDSVSGLIVSNRFMTTRSGANVRRAVLEEMDVLGVWDFGDTKLFQAAVLPAVVLARARREQRVDAPIKFTSIYETTLPGETQAVDPIEAISHRGVVEVRDGRRFIVNHGTLETSGKKDGVWRLSNETTEAWLGKVAQHTWGTFRDIGRVRVGVKTCADGIFIRSDWAQWPLEQRPELLRPILTHHSARRFKAFDLEEPKLILYPHEVQNGYRRAVDIEDYPRSAAYLENCRDILEGRTYLRSSGRRWFEIWVPQDPMAWSKPKLVFRDISHDPIFWIDLDGSVVNGDCYWLTPEITVASDLLWLAVAVGNSNFIRRFYDYRFQNKLYAGRRRFMTQYVEEFPLPDPSSSLGRTIIAKARDTYASVGTRKGEELEEDLNGLVWEAFGLPAEEVAR